MRTVSQQDQEQQDQDQPAGDDRVALLGVLQLAGCG